MRVLGLASFQLVLVHGDRRHAANKKSSAVFTLIKAKYQKGDKKDEFSGWIYARLKPRYGNNDKCKAKVGDKLLAETLRWNDEFKLYSAKIYTAAQAQLVLDAMREVSAEDAKDLANVTVDESIFDDANSAAITMFPIILEGELTLAIGGTTYPFKDILKKEGFEFKHLVNDQPLNLWLRVEPEAQPDMDADDFETLFEQYGFEVSRYDGVEADEAAADEDSCNSDA